MEITQKIREELCDHYARKTHNVRTDKLDELIQEKIAEIVDMVFDLEFEVDYQIEEMSTPVYTDEERYKDCENFVVKYQL